MSRQPTKGPHIFERKGRSGLYAYLNPKQWAVSLGTSDKVQAQINFGKLLEQHRLTPAPKIQRTFAEIAKVLFERLEVNNSPETLRSYAQCALRIIESLEALGCTTPKQLNRGFLESYKAKRLEELKASKRSTNPVVSINRELTALHQLMKIAVDPNDDYRLASVEVLDVIHQCRIREDNRKQMIEVMSEEQIAKLLIHAPDEYREGFHTVLGSGLAYGEIMHLAMDDITDFTIAVTKKEPGFCKCHPVKGWSPKKQRRIRTIRCTQATLAAARKWVQVRDSLTRDNKTINDVLLKSCLKAQIPTITFHALRKTYASHLLKNGNTIAAISRALGHSSVKVTEVYLGIAEDDTLNIKSLKI